MKQTPFERLIHIMSILRSPEGCPWDREQTPESLIPYIAEEACETIDAIVSGDPRAICEELGDLLLQVVFQSQIFHEQGNFTINDVIISINRKLERRHPHVFGDHPTINCPEEQSRLWAQIKEQEKKENTPPARRGILTPQSESHQPALTLALNTIRNAAPLPPSISTDNLHEALKEIIQASTTPDRNAAIDAMILQLVAYRNDAS